MNQVTIELAVSALEAERTRIAEAIADLKAGLNGRATARTQKIVKEATAATVATPARSQGSKGRRRITAAGRVALALAAKRRWAKAKAAGKSTL
jgi:hypothetical protein